MVTYPKMPDESTTRCWRHRFPGCTLARPTEVTGFQPERPGPDCPDPLGALLVPIFVLAEGRPNSNFLFFRTIGRFPPVFLLLWTLSREIPMAIRGEGVVSKTAIHLVSGRGLEQRGESEVGTERKGEQRG